MTGRPTIVEFVRARLDEDEGVARGEITRREVWQRKIDQMRRVGEMIGVGLVDFDGPGAPGDPVRVLAEVEAKRRILKMHKPVPAGYGAEPRWEDRDYIPRVCPSCGVSDGWRDVVAPCPTLRALVLPYADHPDYDPVWTLAKAVQ